MHRALREMRAAGVGITPRIRRNRIQIMFGGLKGWRRVATQYDRRSTVFLSAIALAATVLF